MSAWFASAARWFAARHHRVRGDRGVSAIEAAILAPALLAILALAISAMRIEVAGQSVESAAHDAARAASISRTAGEATTNARATALAALTQQHLQCRGGPKVDVDVSQFGRPIGQEAAVRVVVTCVVNLSDVALPGLPGKHQMTSTFTSEIDQYRGRG